MKFLFLVRHAKSSWDDVAIPDFDRPLNGRGIKDAAEMARRLSKRINNVDAFISSPAQRAKLTAEKFILAFGKDKSGLLFEQGLYLAPASFFNQFISKMDDRFNTVAIFSHNPGITDYANTLTTVVKTDNIPTCGIFAVTAAAGSWKDFSTVEKEFLFFDYPKLPG